MMRRMDHPMQLAQDFSNIELSELARLPLLVEPRRTDGLAKPMRGYIWTDGSHKEADHHLDGWAVVVSNQVESDY
eukprot:6300141-Pyramimonas_sp.AAC.1